MLDIPYLIRIIYQQMSNIKVELVSRQHLQDNTYTPVELDPLGSLKKGTDFCAHLQTDTGMWSGVLTVLLDSVLHMLLSRL
jgi:hypothetical protein